MSTCRRRLLRVSQHGSQCGRRRVGRVQLLPLERGHESPAPGARLYSLSFNGRTNIRLTRGLSLELRGDAARVNDQLFLARGNASDDEVLTRQRALATSFRLSGSVGINFTFGSIYNSIVNPRLDELGQP